MGGCYSSLIVVFTFFCVEVWRCVAALDFNASGSLSMRVTSSRARFDLHALTRRCRVRSCALEYIVGARATSRSCSFLAVMPGSDSSHCWIVGHMCSNGSCRLRHVCGTLVFRWWVGLTSPSCHAVPRLLRNSARATRSGVAVSAGEVPLSMQVATPRCASRIRDNKSNGSSALNRVRSLRLVASGTEAARKTRSSGVKGES
ncbi:hypothetical protein AWB65_06902 [Caballeronia humi]|uniref:Uncharacterized protein n=1 Tax=Caballeronia humi TaxID=326474 RepID=A0A158JP34_9BURK|nr:hypothetical protein AWB65_06902 [Caballeronia humi]